MNKILTRIFSVVLVAATVASPSMAQMAKKAMSPQAKTQKAVAMKAQSSPEKSLLKNADKGTFMLKSRKSSIGSSAFRSQKTGKATLKVKNVAKEAAGVPELFGSVVYNTTFTQGNAPVGLYKLPQAAGATSLLFTGPDASNGGVCVDGVYYCTNYMSFWGMIFITCESYDVATGEKLGEWSPTDISVIGAGGYALDPTSGEIYGITYNSNGDGLQLSKISFDDEVTSTAVAALERNWNSCAFDSNGQLYGISYDGYTEGDSYVVTGSKLNKIDKSTGAVTEIGETGCVPQYISSAAIDVKTNRMFWNVCAPDETGSIYEVNLSTGAATLLYQLDNDDEIVGMYCPLPEAAENAPAVCENVEVVFDEDALNGVVNLMAPATFYDGSNGSGDLTIKVLANGEEVATQSASWGAQVSVPVTVEEAGFYSFVVMASNVNGNGPKTKIKKMWIGADTPAATKASLVYENGNMEVTWNAVTESVNGGYIDLDNLSYTVVRHDGTVAASGLTTTSFTEAVAEPSELTSYFYTVFVIAGDEESEGAETNHIVLGSIVPPYTSDFATDGLQGWTVLDVNEDNSTWSIYSGKLRYRYSMQNDADDWCITPPMKLESGKAYNLTFSSYGYSATYPERLEVKMGKTPTAEGMTTVVVEPTDIVCGEAQAVEFDAMLVPDEDGTYYVGFHAISDKDEFYLYVSDITIEAGISALAPGLASDIVVTPDANGALKANVAFKAPSTTMNNQPLSSLTKVEVLRNDELVKTFDAPAVGAALSFTDEMTEGGNVQYKVIGYNAEGKGLTATASAFIGFDLPAAVESATISRTATDGEVNVTWTAVTTDIHGLPYAAGKVTYVVVDSEGDVIAEDLTGTSYSYQAVEAGQQDFVQLAVYAVSAEGAGQGAYTDMIPVGTPYDGLACSFPDGTLGGYIWGLRSIGGGSVGLMTEESGIPAQDGDNGMIGIKGQYLDTGAELFTGMISLNGFVNPGISFYTFDIATLQDDPSSANADINEISVFVRSIDEEEYTEVMATKTVEEICEGSDNGWGKVVINLNAYANKTVQVMIMGITKQYVYTVLDNIKVGDLLNQDLAAAKIEAPAKVKVGKDYTIDVTVANEGLETSGAYSVELYANEDLIETKDCAALESGAKNVVSFEFTMSPVAQEAISYYAKVVYAADENMDNNQTSSVEVAPVLSTLPAPTNLTGSSEPNGVKLTWNEPNLENAPAKEAPEAVTEDFEDAAAFSAEYGDWTFVDKDDSEVGGFQGTDLPGITPGTTKGSFWIWDTNEVGQGNPTFEAHSGTHYLFALFRWDDGTTDDWAISPALYGGEQTISFYAKSYSSNYPEKIKVAYTTMDSVDPEDYTDVVLTVNSVPGEWTLYQVDLPDGATHFAINSCATSSFMLMVDDVTYIPGSGEPVQLNLKGYNVYRDGVKINDALVEETEFLDTNVEDGKQYTYIVTAVYEDRGESALSNECVVTYTTVGVDAIGDGAVKVTVDGQNIVILNVADKNVTVSSVNGAVVYSGVGEAKTVVPVASGVYVVKADKTVKKVVVK